MRNAVFAFAVLAACAQERPPQLPPRLVSSAGSVAWLTEFRLHADTAGQVSELGRVRAGAGMVVVAIREASGDDLLGIPEVDKGKIAVAAFGAKGERKWLASAPHSEELNVDSMELAPDGSVWIHGMTWQSRDSVLFHFDPAGKLLLEKKPIPAGAYVGGMAIGSAGEVAIGYGSFALETGDETGGPRRSGLVVLDSNGAELGRWEARAGQAEPFYDGAGTLGAQLFLDAKSNLTLAGTTIRGPQSFKEAAVFATIMFGRDVKPIRMTESSRMHQAIVPRVPFIAIDIDPPSDEAGPYPSSADVVRRDAGGRELSRAHVCEIGCGRLGRIPVNARGESVYWGSTEAHNDIPAPLTVRTPTKEPLPARLAKINEKGAIVYTAGASCLTSVDIDRDGTVAVLGLNCPTEEVVIADRKLPTSSLSQSFVAVLRP